MNSFAHNYFLLDLNWDMSSSGCWGTNKEWLCITVCITCEVCCCCIKHLVSGAAITLVPVACVAPSWSAHSALAGLELFQRQRWGNFWEMGFSERIDTILNWTGLLEQLSCCHGCIDRCVLDCGPQWWLDCQDGWHRWRWLRVGYCVCDWRHQLCWAKTQLAVLLATASNTGGMNMCCDAKYWLGFNSV